MEDLYQEDEFYKDDGWPTESLRYCDYRFYNGNISEYGEDFDQFVLIDNALYPYIRLVKKRGSCLSPCGGMSVVYSAIHDSLKTRHAIKVFNVGKCVNVDVLRGKFLAEARPFHGVCDSRPGTGCAVFHQSGQIAQKHRIQRALRAGGGLGRRDDPAFFRTGRHAEGRPAGFLRRAHGDPAAVASDARTKKEKRTVLNGSPLSLAGSFKGQKAHAGCRAARPG